MFRITLLYLWVFLAHCYWGLPSASAQTAGQQDYKAYQSYDFVPGDRILFEDDFRSEKDGEFASHWRLEGGQGVINQFQGEPALVMTDGNYAKVSPGIMPAKYLSDPFTVELDYYAQPPGPQTDKIGISLHRGDDDRNLWFGANVSTEGLEHDLTSTRLSLSTLCYSGMIDSACLI